MSGTERAVAWIMHAYDVDFETAVGIFDRVLADWKVAGMLQKEIDRVMKEGRAGE